MGIGELLTATGYRLPATSYRRTANSKQTNDKQANSKQANSERLTADSEQANRGLY